MTDEIVRTKVVFHFRGGFGPNSDYRLNIAVSETVDEWVGKFERGELHIPPTGRFVKIGSGSRMAVINLDHVGPAQLRNRGPAWARVAAIGTRSIDDSA